MSDNQQMSESSMSSAIDQFCSFTGSTESVARTALESCNWNIDLAVNMFIDQNDGQNAVVANNDTNHVSTASSMDTSNPLSYNTEDDVRPPIPPVRQVLVEDFPTASYSHPLRRGGANSVFDAFRDFEQEARWHEQQMDSESSSNSSTNPTTNKRKTLEDLFRPPLDLMCRGTVEHAKDEGRRLNKWLMINIQNYQEFSCQVLNRDVWSNTAVKDIITEHFIFWQTYHDSSEGQRFMQFYKVKNFPYVAIIDPRTGEELRSWTAIEPVSFCDLVTEFLHDMPSPYGSSNANELINHRKSSPEKALYEESEEMQLKAAIEASLTDASHQTTNNDNDDSDCETFDSDNEDNTKLSNKVSNLSHKTKEMTSFSNVKPSTSVVMPSASVVKQENIEIEDYHKYLGPENGSKFEFVVRYPDGNRENITFPSDSRIKALFIYLSSKGYNMNDFDLITNFPKRNLKEYFTNESDVITLESAGIHSRDTLYVQHKT
ncbi:UBX domain-containing protein 7-like [Oppia nitens]|uniref:UBX domain-containing protein 7-like n=1 Tax=Oppia nitens TaxID=1686743 RepID=UPI0023D9CE22|nr:UBX domain-containing protein 7-like [Oppia nitens]